ncbi:DUF3307 domain-containing protein [Rhizobium sp. L1K21]|uniref:DUF3307 domain-containing protein n=1 Tax=Rhizobium sp. L1K21 TaxID=2954933 RepID=UPI002092F95D|nr:DUF3307 domain-containing protein [Rhizobium sp. L1K21]
MAMGDVMTAFSAHSVALWLAVSVMLFLAKHFLADFVLQNTWMIVGKEAERRWLVPLVAHAGVHALLTGLIFTALAPKFAVMAMLADFIIHGCIDRIKAVATRRLDVTHTDPMFWWLFGADQLLHNLTHLGFSIAIASAA